VGQNDFQRARPQTRQGRDGVAFFSSARSLAGGAADRRPSERLFWILGAVVTLAVFLPSVRNGWVNWDDADNFLGNPHFRGLGWSNIRWIFSGSVQDAHWIPLTWLTLSLDYVIWGMNPAGYHLTSLLIHSVNALLCYVLAYRLLELGFGARARPRDLRRIAPALGSGVVTATVLWIVARAALTVPQIGIWKDSVTLWERAAEPEPQSDIPSFYLGWALTEAGRFDEAQAHFERSLARVPPDLPALRAQFLFHLGIVEQRRGRPADAEARFREALRLDPQHPAGWIRLGVILWARGQREEATRAWAEAVSLAPRGGAYDLWEIRLAVSEVLEVAAVARGRLAFNLGALLEQYRQPGQALEQYRVAAALLPDDLTACGRAKRLSAAVAPGEAVACAPRGRP
jgi:tetratricopeptide (TPR) repeat protein